MAKDLCPLLNKECIEHDCKFYIHVTGTDPQTGGEVDAFDCAMVFIPKLLIENAQQSRQVGSAIESFRNEVVKQNQSMAQLLEKAGEKQEIFLITQNDEK